MSDISNKFYSFEKHLKSILLKNEIKQKNSRQNCKDMYLSLRVWSYEKRPQPLDEKLGFKSKVQPFQPNFCGFLNN